MDLIEEVHQLVFKEYDTIINNEIDKELLNKIYILLKLSHQPQNIKEICEYAFKFNYLYYIEEWKELMTKTGGGQILDKLAEVGKQTWAILNDPNVQNAAQTITGKIRGIIGKQEDVTLEKFIDDIYCDLNEEVQEFNNNLQNKISLFNALVDNELIFKQSPIKCKTIFNEAYEKIMSNNPSIQYKEEELIKYKPTQNDITLYNNYILEKYINEMDSRIKFEKTNGYNNMLIVDKLIEKNKINKNKKK